MTLTSSSKMNANEGFNTVKVDKDVQVRQLGEYSFPGRFIRNVH